MRSRHRWQGCRAPAPPEGQSEHAQRMAAASGVLGVIDADRLVDGIPGVPLLDVRQDLNDPVVVIARGQAALTIGPLALSIVPGG